MATDPSGSAGPPAPYVHWHGAPPVHVESVEELDAAIDRAEAETLPDAPRAVSVVIATGESLTLGVGAAETVASYAGPDGLPPYYASVGDRGRRDTVWYSFAGQRSDFPGWQAVPAAAARKAARHFFRTGKLLPSIEWESV